ncbi:MAG: glycosyltransferase [Flavobacteriales bacterium]
MHGTLPWILLIATAALLIIQLFVVLGSFRHLLDHDELPAFGGQGPFISVIVPVRNEAEHLPELLDDLRSQEYPTDRFEVIVVDDGSEDSTLAKAQRFERAGFSVVQLLGAVGKKAAIELGVEHAKGALIVITDADARCGPLRLKTIARAWQRAPFDMLLMPINVGSNGSLLEELQANEQAGFMAVAIASARAGRAVLANGANLAFRRSVFEALHGFDGNRHIASGDDMFLLEKMRSANKTVTSLAVPEVVVMVAPAINWRSFLQQRLRWAGKMKAVRFGAMSLLPLSALLIPVLLWMCTLHSAVPWRVAPLLWCAWLIPLVVLVTSANGTVGRKASPFSIAMHLVLFSIYAPVIALVSAFFRPRWKGRTAQNGRSSSPSTAGASAIVGGGAA